MSELQEKKIREKIKERETIIARNHLLSTQELTQKLEELQREHQQVLSWEVQSKGEEKERLTALREEIERQQQRITIPQQRDYQSTALKFVPPQTVAKNTIMAFLVGGAICLLGQVIKNVFLKNGLPDQDAAAATSAILIFLGAFFTGIGYYDRLGKIAGAGSLVPITGFANSIVSSGLEYKKEGYIYGVGAHLFTVAGPVLAYGTMVSILVGLVYYFAK